MRLGIGRGGRGECVGVLTMGGDEGRQPDSAVNAGELGSVSRRRLGLRAPAGGGGAQGGCSRGAPRASAHAGLLFYGGASGAVPPRGGGAMAAWPMGHERSRRLGRCGRGRAGVGWVGPQARPNPVDFPFFRIYFQCENNSRKHLEIV
jgi:hypothetical protein